MSILLIQIVEFVHHLELTPVWCDSKRRGKRKLLGNSAERGLFIQMETNGQYFTPENLGTLK